MSDRIEGVPEGYRLGDVVYLREDRQNITFELIPIEPEQPKQLEAVETDDEIRQAWREGKLKVVHPGRLTIREKGAK